MTYDVVVVGTGNAALCAAISARESGANVLIVEKAPKEKKGGNSFFTDGAIRFPYGNIENLENIVPEINKETIHLPSYNKEDFYADLTHVTNHQTDTSLSIHLINHAYNTILWMKKQGVEFELNENQYFKRNGMLQFWGGLPVKTKNKGIGLIDSLIEKVSQKGIHIQYQSKATRLEKIDNKISGIYIESKNKKTQKIKTNAVILACGGFEANKVKRVKYLGKEWENAIVRGTEYNTGDGIAMALEVGARKKGQYNGCHAHTTDYNAPSTGDFNKPGDIYKKSSYPLGIIVNTEGNRFVDEGADFRNYTYAKYGKETLKQPNQIAFQLYDKQVMSLLRKEYHLPEATVFQANDLESLASQMKINRDNFIKTVKEYNNNVQEGYYNPGIKDKKKAENIIPVKSNWALQINTPPYFAYPVTCGITFTFGGVGVNNRGEVLGDNNNPIPGLYAAGELVGGLFYDNYPGGSGLMAGSVFGKTAGEHSGKYSVNLRQCFEH